MTLDILWPDSTLQSVTYGYDEARLFVSYSRGTPEWELSGQTRIVVAEGPIGIRYDGLWDEVLIARAVVSADHPYAQVCWSAIQGRRSDRLDSGSPARNARTFKTLEIVFEDGSYLWLAAATFRVEPS